MPILLRDYAFVTVLLTIRHDLAWTPRTPSCRPAAPATGAWGPYKPVSLSAPSRALKPSPAPVRARGAVVRFTQRSRLSTRDSFRSFRPGPTARSSWRA